MAALALAVLSLACDGGDSATSARRQEEKVKVATSLGIFADFVKEVGGDRVEVASLLPAGADPHTFEPSPSDVRKITEADVVFINGLGLEGGLEQIVLANVDQPDRLVYLSGIRGPAEMALEDVHWWLDATKAIEYVSRVQDALIQADPAGDAYYRTRAQAYVQELRDLDGSIRAQAEAIPASRRKLITYHKSFNAFADRYGFEVAGYVVASPGGDPSPDEIHQLLDEIRNEGIPAVFSEPQLNAKLLKQIAADAGVSVCTLYSDALDDRVSSYVQMMRFNADELVRCLEGGAGG